jgi:uncharacterized membrane protein YhhN
VPDHRAQTALYCAVSAADAILAATGRGSTRRYTKPLLMPVLMIGRDAPVQRALALCWGGDVALLGDSALSFQVGLGSFLAGHVSWVVALRRRSTQRIRRQPWLVVPYVAAWCGLNAYLWRRTGRDRIPVLVYSAALLATALAALDTGDARLTAGGFLFLTSDSLLALHRFGNVTLPGHEGLVMATYTSAQALLAG